MPHHPILVTAALLAFLASPAGAASARKNSSPEERAQQTAAEYSATFSRIDRVCDWHFCRDRRMRHLWELVGEWLSAYLETHPDASASELAASLKELHAPPGKTPWNIDGEVLEVRPGDFLVTVRIFETGTFFIVGRSSDGAARVKWSIDRFASSPTADRKLRCWRVRADCGPLYGFATSLPATAAGDAHFYVNALHAGNGATVGAQTSIWAWNGRDARLLAVGGHLVMIEDERQIEFDGQHLVVPTKEVPRSFSTVGGSLDPAGIWTVRLTPDGAEDLGHRWRDPELQWADELFDALKKGRETIGLAAPEVVRKLEPVLDDLDSLLMDWTATGGTPDVFRIALDGVTLTFTLQRDGDRLYATAVKVE